MKKLLALIVVLGAVMVLTGSGGLDWGAGSRVDGAWRMVEPRTAPNVEHIKILAGGQFTWITVEDGKIVRAAGGKYVARGQRYMEVIEYTLQDEPEWMVGKELWFARKLEHGKWIHTGVPDGIIQGKEVWERIRR